MTPDAGGGGEDDKSQKETGAAGGDKEASMSVGANSISRCEGCCFALSDKKAYFSLPNRRRLRLYQARS